MENKSDYVPPHSGIFRTVKIVLYNLQALSIVGAIIRLVFGATDDELQEQQKEDIVVFGRTFIIISSILDILIAGIGLLGTLKENFNFVVSYAVILAIAAFAAFAGKSVFEGIFFLIVAGIAFYFAYLVNRVRGQYVA